MSDDGIHPEFLDRIDESKRSSIRKMLLGTAFVVPAVVSFSLNGLAISEAHAQPYAVNSTGPFT